MKNWLNRCESVCCPDTDLLSADKEKLRNELLNVQVNHFYISCLLFTEHYICVFSSLFSVLLHLIQSVSCCFCVASSLNNDSPIQEMQGETASYEALLQGLVNLALCLYPTASETRVEVLSYDLTQLEERCTSVKNSISHRYLSFNFSYKCFIILLYPSIIRPAKCCGSMLFVLLR